MKQKPRFKIPSFPSFEISDADVVEEADGSFTVRGESLERLQQFAEGIGISEKQAFNLVMMWGATMELAEALGKLSPGDAAKVQESITGLMVFALKIGRSSSTTDDE